MLSVKLIKIFIQKVFQLKKNIKVINSLYDQGYIIKIFTARYMGRFK